MSRVAGVGRVVGIVLAGVLLLQAAAAGAAPVRTKVALRLPEDAGEAGREAMRVRGLALMIQRLAGQPVPEAHQALRDSVGRYLTSEAVRQEEQGRTLVLTFDSQALRGALRERGVAVWLRERPRLVLWTAVTGASGRQLAAADHPLSAPLQSAAADHGVPVLWPLLDLADRQAVGYQDIAGGFSGVIGEATRRYGTPLALALVVRRDAGWQARWALVDGGRASGEGRVSGGDPQALATRLWSAVAQRLRTDYTVTPGSEREPLPVVITGIGGLGALVAAERALGGSPGVLGVRLRSIDGERVLFRVDSEVSEQRLAAALRRSPRWQPATLEDNEAGLAFRWSRSGETGDEGR